MTEKCSGRQGQLIIWAAAEAHRLRRMGDGTDGDKPGSKPARRATQVVGSRGTAGLSKVLPIT